MENARALEALLKTIADNVKELDALKTNTKSIVEHGEALETNYPVEKNRLILNYITTSKRVKENVRAFGEGFTDALSPSFFLWVDDDDYRNPKAMKGSSLGEIWEQVGEHIDAATSTVVAWKQTSGGTVKIVRKRSFFLQLGSERLNLS
jgi:hypothetical protein